MLITMTRLYLHAFSMLNKKVVNCKLCVFNSELRVFIYELYLYFLIVHMTYSMTYISRDKTKNSFVPCNKFFYFCNYSKQTEFLETREWQIYFSFVKIICHNVSCDEYGKLNFLQNISKWKKKNNNYIPRNCSSCKKKTTQQMCASSLNLFMHKLKDFLFAYFPFYIESTKHPINLFYTVLWSRKCLRSIVNINTCYFSNDNDSNKLHIKMFIINFVLSLLLHQLCNLATYLSRSIKTLAMKNTMKLDQYYIFH